MISPLPELTLREILEHNYRIEIKILHLISALLKQGHEDSAARQMARHDQEVRVLLQELGKLLMVHQQKGMGRWKLEEAWGIMKEVRAVYGV
jgi:hypothetical protein